MQILATVSLAIALAAAETPTVTGTWNMGLQGDHVIPTALVLKQEDKKVTGTIALPTQQNGKRVEVELTGDFVDGALTLTGTLENAAEPTKVAIAGKLLEDGSLEGTIALRLHNRDHNLAWTAERLKERK
jgi:hypothetical protein